MGICGWRNPFGPDGWFTGHSILGMLWAFFFVLLILLLLVIVLRVLASKRGANKDKKDSLEFLERKFARGEISTEDYHRMRNVLNG